MQNYNIESWFPVDILISKASKEVLDVAKEEFILAKDILETIHKEYNGVTNGVTTYNRGISIPINNNTQLLVDFILDSCAVLAKKHGVDLDNVTLNLTSIWLNRLGKQGAHAKHAHGGVHYSGTLYVNIPDGASNIRFYNPHTDIMSLSALPVKYDGDPSASLYVDFKPEEGKLLVWNSYLYHEVLENTIDNFRDTISFNITVALK